MRIYLGAVTWMVRSCLGSVHTFMLAYIDWFAQLEYKLLKARTKCQIDAMIPLPSQPRSIVKKNPGENPDVTSSARTRKTAKLIIELFNGVV